jgi:hypothetical protein
LLGRNLSLSRTPAYRWRLTYRSEHFRRGAPIVTAGYWGEIATSIDNSVEFVRPGDHGQMR